VQALTKTFFGFCPENEMSNFQCTSKLRLHQLMLVMYHWASDSPQWLVMREVRASNQTIVDWYNFLREVCVLLLLVFVHNGMMQTMVPKS